MDSASDTQGLGLEGGTTRQGKAWQLLCTTFDQQSFFERLLGWTTALRAGDRNDRLFYSSQQLVDTPPLNRSE